MTQDEIIEMAKQAGFSLAHSDLAKLWLGNSKNIEAFAKQVAAKSTDEANARANASWTLMCKKMVEAEREACAELARKTVCDTHIPTGVKIYGSEVAKAIRAKGEA